MKSNRFGCIEFLGCLGILIWFLVVLQRNTHFQIDTSLVFFMGLLPNLGAAWCVTLLGKWIVIFGCKKDYSIFKHGFICIIIVACSLISEISYDLFFASPFDYYDILVTIIAQLLMFFIPIIMKDKSFKPNDDF